MILAAEKIFSRTPITISIAEKIFSIPEQIFSINENIFSMS